MSSYYTLHRNFGRDFSAEKSKKAAANDSEALLAGAPPLKMRKRDDPKGFSDPPSGEGYSTSLGTRLPSGAGLPSKGYSGAGERKPSTERVRMKPSTERRRKQPSGERKPFLATKVVDHKTPFQTQIQKNSFFNHQQKTIVGRSQDQTRNSQNLVGIFSSGDRRAGALHPKSPTKKNFAAANDPPNGNNTAGRNSSLSEQQENGEWRQALMRDADKVMVTQTANKVMVTGGTPKRGGFDLRELSLTPKSATIIEAIQQENDQLALQNRIKQIELRESETMLQRYKKQVLELEHALQMQKVDRPKCSFGGTSVLTATTERGSGGTGEGESKSQTSSAFSFRSKRRQSSETAAEEQGSSHEKDRTASENEGQSSVVTNTTQPQANQEKLPQDGNGPGPSIGGSRRGPYAAENPRERGMSDGNSAENVEKHPFVKSLLEENRKYAKEVQKYVEHISRLEHIVSTGDYNRKATKVLKLKINPSHRWTEGNNPHKEEERNGGERPRCGSEAIGSGEKNGGTTTGREDLDEQNTATSGEEVTNLKKRLEECEFSLDASKGEMDKFRKACKAQIAIYQRGVEKLLGIY